MEYIDVPAPEGLRASWRVEPGEDPDTDDLLIIEVSDDLRPIDRRRHIQRALQWAREQYGVEPHRRGIFPLPLVPGKPLHHAVGNHKAAATVIGVAGAGIVAVAIVPAVLHDDNTDSVLRRPPAAAPAPQWPGRPPALSRTPGSPWTPPSAAPPVALTRRPAGLPVDAVPVSVAPPLGIPSAPTSPPQLPVPPAPKPQLVTTRRPPPLLAAPLPLARVRVRPKLSVRADLGSVHLGVGSAQPIPGRRP